MGNANHGRFRSYQELSREVSRWGDYLTNAEFLEKQEAALEDLDTPSSAQLGFRMRAVEASERQADALESIAASLKWVKTRVEKWERKERQRDADDKE